MKIFVRSLFGWSLITSVLAADPLNDAFQRGLLAEDGQGDFKAAATAYAEVVRASEAQRELLATALFRLAEMQRRLGQTNEASASYLRLVREYVEQTNLVELARAQLPANQERSDEEVSVRSALQPSPAKSLLQEEIKLAEEQLALVQQRRDQKVASQTELLQAQREVLALKRQLAALQEPNMAKLHDADPALPPNKSNGAVTVVGEVNQPGVIQLSRDSNLDLVQVIVLSGNFSKLGDPNKIQVRRGTNLFRFRFDEAMSNRFELRSGDLVEVKKKVLNF